MFFEVRYLTYLSTNPTRQSCNLRPVCGSLTHVTELKTKHIVPLKLMVQLFLMIKEEVPYLQ